jgi:hypothetical protein
MRQLSGLSLGVFVSGAAVAEIETGESCDLAAIEPHLAHELVNHLYDLPEAVLVFRDGALAGHDYLVTGRGELTANTEWWFSSCEARVHRQDRPGPEDLHHTLRVGLVTTRSRMHPVIEEIEHKFVGRVLTHYFEAVNAPDDCDSMFVLEVFADGVDKWRGIQMIARQHGIGDDRIAAIGDQINDVTMIRNSALGIAMANAVDAVKQIADVTTEDHREDGVANALERISAGEWIV